MLKVLKSPPTCYGVDPSNYMIICAFYMIVFDNIARAISFRSFDAERRFRSRFENKAFLSAFALYFLLQLIICENTLHLELGYSDEKQNKDNGVNGIFWILLLNFGIYAVDYVFQPRMVEALYLDHSKPVCYQFVTGAFCHASWQHLFGNLFYMYYFGKIVQQEVGSFALWVCYILTGVGGTIMSWLLLPTYTISVGSSGAVYGLFAISLFVKMHFEWKDVLLLFILAYEFVSRVRNELQASAEMLDAINRGDWWPTNHIAHVSGAFTGVSLGCLRAMVPMLVLNLTIKFYYISISQSRSVTNGQIN